MGNGYPIPWRMIFGTSFPIPSVFCQISNIELFFAKNKLLFHELSIREPTYA